MILKGILAKGHKHVVVVDIKGPTKAIPQARVFYVTAVGFIDMCSALDIRVYGPARDWSKWLGPASSETT